FHFYFFYLTTRRLSYSTLVPYTTLFRSDAEAVGGLAGQEADDADPERLLRLRERRGREGRGDGRRPGEAMQLAVGHGRVSSCGCLAVSGWAGQRTASSRRNPASSKPRRKSARCRRIQSSATSGLWVTSASWIRRCASRLRAAACGRRASTAPRIGA